MTGSVDLHKVDPDAAKLVTPAAVKRYQAVPVSFVSERTLLVAMADPANVLAVDDIAVMTGYEVRPAVASSEDIEWLLERLEEEERESRSSSRVIGEVAASGAAGAAVQQALAQVGDAYVYGATGPDAFDCSGLTMFAWAAAGVSLPHSSSAQMGSGTPVSIDALQPGDLVFYYSPVSHVGMYIGNGQIVHASNPSSPVSVAPVFSMPYSGAVRPG